MMHSTSFWFGVLFSLANLVPSLLYSQQSDDRFLPEAKQIRELVNKAIKDKKLPGAVVKIGSSNETFYFAAIGDRQLVPQNDAMTRDTVFDLASLTKPIATATSIMILAEAGKIQFDDPVSKYIPEFKVNGKEEITVKQLLTHTSGLIPDNHMRDYQDGRKVAFEKINNLKPRWEPGSRFAYSDVGFLVLGAMVEKTSGQQLDRFAREKIFQPLGMNETGYNIGEKLAARSAVTQTRNKKWMKGTVHDPRAFALGGVAGHAGLFSTADDLEKYCRMMLNKGSFRDTRILEADSIEKMNSAITVPGGGIRSLGWDKNSAYSSNRGKTMSDSAFGHGGFTGTAMWIDPDLDLYVIFLSNRVHPDGKGSVNRLAGAIGTIAADWVRKNGASK